MFTYINLKTVIFNFYYLPFRDALHLPVFLSRNAKLRRLKGSVILACPVKMGVVRIGAAELGIFDKRHNRPVWENAGTVIFDENVVIKYGAKIIVGCNGILKLGKNFRLSSGSFIICYKSVEIGDDCRISWNCQIMDTDFHGIKNADGVHINPDKAIKLGNNCWIGNHSSVLKGTSLNNMVVLASHSLINKPVTENNVILAGIPANIIRTSITWGNLL